MEENNGNESHCIEKIEKQSNPKSDEFILKKSQR